MKQFDQFTYFQEQCIERIARDLVHFTSKLTYNIDEIQVKLLSKNNVNLTVKFQRTLNNGITPSYKYFLEDALFKKATITFNYNNLTFYTILRYRKNKWYISKSSLKVLNNYLLSNDNFKYEQYANIIDYMKTLCQYVMTTKAKRDKQVIGSIYYC